MTISSIERYLDAAERAIDRGDRAEAATLYAKAQQYGVESPRLDDLGNRLRAEPATADSVRGSEPDPERKIRTLAAKAGVQIHQFTTTLAYGDGVGNCIRLANRILCDWGFPSVIFAEGADERLKGEWIWYGEHQRVQAPQNLALYHPSDGRSPMIRYLASIADRKVLYYHNITPAEYFAPWDAQNAEICRTAREAVALLRPMVRTAICDSAYNAEDLRSLGYEQTSVVHLPLFRDEIALRRPTPELLASLNDGRTNILFVGRIAPNKCQHELIAVLTAYRIRFDPKARLILAGSANGTAAYTDHLRRLAGECGEGSVLFTGHTTPEDLAAYYRASHVFLCLSEHEGFCLPLLEAMHFGIPIVAFRSSAVTETIGDSSLLLDTKDPFLVAARIHSVRSDPSLREDILTRQEARLTAFTEEHYRKTLAAALLPFVEDPLR